MHRTKTNKTVHVSFRTAPDIRLRLAQDAELAGHDNISIIARAIIQRHYRKPVFNRKRRS